MDKFDELEDIESLQIVNENNDTSFLQSLKKQYFQKTTKLKEIMSLFLENKLNYDEYKIMKGTLEESIKELKKDIKKEKKKLEVSNCDIDKNKISKNIKDHWQYLTQDEKREFLKEFVKEIVIVNRSKDRKSKQLPEILEVKFYMD